VDREATGDGPRTGREYSSTAVSSLRRVVETGALTATIGGVGLLSAFQSFRAGKRTLGLAKVALGSGLLTVAVVQWRSHNRSGAPDGEETEGVDTGAAADVTTDEAGGADGGAHAESETAVAIDDTSLDIEDVGSGLESNADTAGESAPTDHRGTGDSGVDSEDFVEAGTIDGTTAEGNVGIGEGAETEELEILGEAAFDRQSREVPAPQQAFNRGFLAHSSMVCWGIRERDDAVLIAQDYDAIENREGVTYVASSEIGKDVRELPIPDAVLDHWDEVIGGGTAVTGGDDILFATTESLADDGLLRVLPAEWTDGPTD